ncbi:MAG: hypothetical protein JRH18_12675 [Deltaproteobacteria bacterium]|nr:hypothetical protein [Deltaproteobacteria bacterium]MBW2152511.1 hypothetical protein [Deltaproteobacteria bacterium]
MHDENAKKELEFEAKRHNFVRAAQLAASCGLREEEVQNFRAMALWQMAAVNRNALGTRILADEYGYSKENVKHILETQLERSQRNSKPLKSRYDPATGRYLSFKEWMDLLLKNWNRMVVKNEGNHSYFKRHPRETCRAAR